MWCYAYGQVGCCWKCVILCLSFNFPQEYSPIICRWRDIFIWRQAMFSIKLWCFRTKPSKMVSILIFYSNSFTYEMNSWPISHYIDNWHTTHYLPGYPNDIKMIEIQNLSLSVSVHSVQKPAFSVLGWCRLSIHLSRRSLYIQSTHCSVKTHGSKFAVDLTVLICREIEKMNWSGLDLG